MAASWLPRTDTGRFTWLNAYAPAFATHAATLNMSGEVTLTNYLRDSYSWLMIERSKIKLLNSSWTAFAQNATEGKTAWGAYPALPSIAAAPPLPAGVTAPTEGIFRIIRAQVGRAKKALGFTEAIGAGLDVLGPDDDADPNTAKPLIRLALDGDGQPQVLWDKLDWAGVDIWVDRGTGPTFLARDTIPHYTDTHALPPIGQTALWKYIAQYVQGDDRIGLQSDLAQIPVVGR